LEEWSPDLSEFFLKLFDTSDFPARWHCGNWSAGTGWLHIVSDIATAGAYVAIPCVLIWFVCKRRDPVFPKVYWLFAAFILACGSVHLIEAIIFWFPVYRFSGLMKSVTAVASWATVIAVVRIAPDALQLPSIVALNRRLEEEAKHRRKVEERLNSILNSIGDGVMVSDCHGNVEFMNPSAGKIFQFEESDKTYQERFARYEIFDADGVRQITGDQLPLLKAGSGVFVDETEFVIRCKAKNLEATIELAASPVTGESGEVSGAVAVFRDISKLKRERSARISSEARLEAIVDSISDGIAVASADGSLERINPAARSILGMGRVDAPKNDWSQKYGLYRAKDRQLCPADELPLVQALAGNLRAKTKLIVSNQFLEDDVLIEVRAMPMYDEQQRISGAVAVFHDITETNKLEVEKSQLIQRLEETVALAAAMTDATQNAPGDDSPLLRVVARTLKVDWTGIATCTDNETVEWRALDARNDEVSTATIAKQEWKDLDCGSLTSRPLVIDSLETPGGTVGNIVVTGLQFEESTRGALMVARSGGVLSGEEQEVLHRISVLIAPAVFTRQQLVETQRQNTAIAQQLREARGHVDRLARVNTLGEITAGIAHELNQPLTAIVNFTDEAHAIIEEKLDTSTVNELASLIQKAHAQAGRAGDILQSIRSIIRSEPRRAAPFDLLELIHETTALLAEETSGVLIRVESFNASGSARRKTPVIIAADRTQIQQVLINLLKNAATAVASQPRKEIVVRVRDTAPGICFSVSDSGTGVERSQIDQVFDAFYTTGNAGLGLGLKICRTIVELHGGRIEATVSDLGGATFSVAIPD